MLPRSSQIRHRLGPGQKCVTAWGFSVTTVLVLSAYSGSRALLSWRSSRVSASRHNHVGHQGGGKMASMLVGGHRGMGQNRAPPSSSSEQSPAPFDSGIRENTILSLSRAHALGADFVEFDVQVTKDGVPVLFHDNLIWVKDLQGQEEGFRIPDLQLAEFHRINTEAIPQGRLLRRRKDGTLFVWKEKEEDEMPTLAQVFEGVPASLGFNIELKFPADDSVDVTDADVAHMLDHVLPVVKQFQSSQGRRIFFSSFVPQAVIELRKREPHAEVFFLTVGKPGLFKDERMNSVQAAVDLAKSCSLQGVNPEVGSLLATIGIVEEAAQAGLGIVTWGEQNNLKETITQQMDMGVYAVIADDVETAMAAKLK